MRIGINTGEALVRLNDTPGSGEGFLTGDAVNVAARLEAAAPPMGVVVGTDAVQRERDLSTSRSPSALKGKREPLEVWLAKQPLARIGATVSSGRRPFVGRQVELVYLTALLGKAVDSSSPQVALVVGEPGIGKTRLVAELFAKVDSGSRLAPGARAAACPTARASRSGPSARS